MILSYQHDIAKSAPASKGLGNRQAEDDALISNFPHGLPSSKRVRRDAQIFTFPRRNSDSAQTGPGAQPRPQISTPDGSSSRLEPQKPTLTAWGIF